MNLGKINKKAGKKRILIAPLDWGLGHATRCIPIIKFLIQQGSDVFIAADGPAAALLQKEFSSLTILPLKGYGISYSRSKQFFFIKMLTQFPKVISAIKHEKSWLKDVISEFEIDAVISDNRFGLYSKKIPCVFITHQLFIETGSKTLSRLAQKINYRYIKHFTECWVPDERGTTNIAGQLSHPDKLPAVPVKYLGILSRCEKSDIQKDLDLLIMISGPEPQRSIFEQFLLSQLTESAMKVLFLRGLPAAADTLQSENKNVTVINHLPAQELNSMMQRATLVIARCGYSTVMDLVALKQKAILIPTPGQAEQEYLAKYLLEKKIFYTVSQQHFSLEKEIKKVEEFDFTDPGISSTMNETVISEWLKTI